MKVPFRRYGGKVYLAKWVLQYFPKHTTYLEPFAGSASVFFLKQPSKAEFLNDLDGRIVNAFRQIKENPKEMAALLWATPYSSENWRQEPQSDLEAAALFIASSQQFYAGATHTSTFSVDRGHANKNKAAVWADWFQRILPAAARLKNAQILNMDAIEFIERFKDREDFLFYVDPPYFGHEKEYGHSVNYKRLVDVLQNIKGKVVVSECLEGVDLWKGWNVVTKEVTGRARTGSHKMVAKKNTECLLMNFKI